jgi:acyl-CoA thioesterase I
MLRRLLSYILILLLSAPLAANAGTVLVVGDSLSAAFGIDVESGWVAQLQKRLTAQGLDYKVINASISGDTTAGGRARLPALLSRHRPGVVVLELGGNDGLRGLSIEQMKRNLSAMIVAAKGANARVVLVGIRLPPNYGPQYNQRFQRVYKELADTHQVALVPFLLDGLRAEEALQPDGIHPTAASQPRMLDNVWSTLKSVL